MPYLLPDCLPVVTRKITWRPIVSDAELLHRCDRDRVALHATFQMQEPNPRQLPCPDHLPLLTMWGLTYLEQ